MSSEGREGVRGKNSPSNGLLQQLQRFLHWILMRLSRTVWTSWRMEPHRFSGPLNRLEDNRGEKHSQKAILGEFNGTECRTFPSNSVSNAVLTRISLHTRVPVRINLRNPLFWRIILAEVIFYIMPEQGHRLSGAHWNQSHRILRPKISRKWVRSQSRKM